MTPIIILGFFCDFSSAANNSSDGKHWTTLFFVSKVWEPPFYGRMPSEHPEQQRRQPNFFRRQRPLPSLRWPDVHDEQSIFQKLNNRIFLKNVILHEEHRVLVDAPGAPVWRLRRDRFGPRVRPGRQPGLPQELAERDGKGQVAKYLNFN